MFPIIKHGLSIQRLICVIAAATIVAVGVTVGALGIQQVSPTSHGSVTIVQLQ
jgi:hypothetical protein